MINDSSRTVPSPSDLKKPEPSRTCKLSGTTSMSFNRTRLPCRIAPVRDKRVACMSCAQESGRVTGWRRGRRRRRVCSSRDRPSRLRRRHRRNDGARFFSSSLTMAGARQSVEVVTLLYSASMAMSAFFQNNLLLRKACNSSVPFGACAAGETHAQHVVSVIYSWKAVVQYVIPVVLIALAGEATVHFIFRVMSFFTYFSSKLFEKKKHSRAQNIYARA